VVAVVLEPPQAEALAGELERHLRAADAEAMGAVVLVESPDAAGALALANDFAPEHLQLIGADVEALAARASAAGCLFLGVASGTAFGDYVAGSNHVLPTAGAARFSSMLAARHFRRTMAEVRIGADAAAKLAQAGAPIARAEGFEWHARSMRARMHDNERLS
jgi:histidinol dehydrogenase